MLDLMRIFYHIVKTGSLTKAAPLLKMDQPTLTRKLAMLEKKLGFNLMKRRAPNTPLKLSEKGEVVFRTAQKALVMMDMMNTELYDYEGLKGKVRLSTTHAVMNYMVGPLLPEFLEKYPNIEVELICDDKQIDPYSNEVDLVIRPFVYDDTDLIQEPIFTLKAGAYASPDYLKKFGTPKTIQDLDHHKLIIYARGHEVLYAKVNWLLEIGREGSESRKPFYTVNSIEQFLSAAEAGVGIVSGYEPMLRQRKSNLVPIFKEQVGPVYEAHLIHPKEMEDVQKIMALKNFLMDKLSDKK